MQVWVPDDIMAVQAYILWEKAGKPDGADFAQAARDEIHRQLKAGQKLEARPPSSGSRIGREIQSIQDYFLGLS